MSNDMRGYSDPISAALTPAQRRYRAAVLADGPVAYWPLDSSGNSVVGSGSEFTWQRSGSSGVRNGNGLFLGGAASTFFNPTPSAIQIPFTSSLAAPIFSLEFWVIYCHTDNTVILQCNGNQFSLQLINSSPSVGINLNLGSSANRYYTTANTTNDGLPHHVVCVTLSSTTAQIYIDRAAVGTGAVGTFAPSFGGQPFYLGSANGAAGVRGGVSDLAYYNYALSASQVAAHYAARQ